MHKLERILNNLLEKQVGLLAFSLVFLSIIALRVFIEFFLAPASPLSFYEVVIEYIHNLYFFLISFVFLWILISFILKKNPEELSAVFTWASLLIIFPPLIDMIRTKGEVYWSFYIVSSWQDLKIQFFTIFGHLPSGIVYFGTKLVFATAIALLTALVFIKTRDTLKSLITAIFSYIILFFMGAFPTIFAYFYYVVWEGRKLGEIQAFHVAQLFGSPIRIWGLEPMGLEYSFPYKLDIVYFPFLLLGLLIIFYLFSPKKLWAVIKNFRYPQLLYHAGLFFIGMGLGYLAYPDDFNFNVFSIFTIMTLISSIWLAWKASVVANDIIDLEIDRISNPSRPLPSVIFTQKEYIHLGIVCFLLSLLGGMSVGTKFFVLLIIYQIIAWFYSGYPFRLKKFPVIATATSAVASLMVMFMGFIVMSPDQSIHNLSWKIILLLFISYTLSLPIKDFKDIEGDKKDHIWTIPVIFGPKNSRLIVAVSVFISFILSVFFLNELKLFLWALIFGAISFLIINYPQINPKRLPWWMMIPVTLYFLILVKIVFVDNIGKFIK